MASRPVHGKDLTQGGIGKTLILFALPTLVSSILQSLNGSINSIWIGRFLGENALASTFNANFIMFLLMAFVFGFGMASTVLIGQAFGAKDLDQARKVVGTAIGSFLPVAVIIGVIGWFASPALLKLLAMPPDAMPLALSYLRVIFCAMPAILLLVMLMMALRGAGDAMTPLYFMILAVILDACSRNVVAMRSHSAWTHRSRWPPCNQPSRAGSRRRDAFITRTGAANTHPSSIAMPWMLQVCSAR